MGVMAVPSPLQPRWVTGNTGPAAPGPIRRTVLWRTAEWGPVRTCPRAGWGWGGNGRDSPGVWCWAAAALLPQQLSHAAECWGLSGIAAAVPRSRAASRGRDQLWAEVFSPIWDGILRQ